MKKVYSRAQAWTEADNIFSTDYEKDENLSARAGYDIYKHATLNPHSRICDLGNRLEVVTGEFGENVVNIWIEEPIKEKRFINFLDLRQLCIRNKWYTLGTVEEYNSFLISTTKMENVTVKEIVEIAEDIKEHSKIDYELTDICFEIGRICISTFR